MKVNSMTTTKKTMNKRKTQYIIKKKTIKEGKKPEILNIAANL